VRFGVGENGGVEVRVGKEDVLVGEFVGPCPVVRKSGQCESAESLDTAVPEWRAAWVVQLVKRLGTHTKPVLRLPKR